MRNIRLFILLLIAVFAFYCVIDYPNNSLISFAQNVHKDKGANSSIPSYAVNQFGNKSGSFPLYALTNDKKYETGISWSPHSIKTNEPIAFILDFFSYPQNEPLHLWPYNFILIQNDKEIYRTNGITQMGSSVEKYTFNSPGKLLIKIESSQDPGSFTQYGTIIYKNSNSSFNSLNNVQNIPSPSSLGLITSYFLVYTIYIFIIAIVIVLVVLVIYIKKSKVKDDYYI